MGNSCSNTASATVDTVKKAGKDAGDKMNEAFATDADAQAAKNGVGDPNLIATKAELKALLPAVTALADAYRPHIQKSNDLLHLPSLAVWTTELPFLGGEDAIKPIHDLASHVDELSSATLRARASAIKRYVDDLTECQMSLRSGVDALNAYLQAEVSLKDKEARLQQAKAKAGCGVAESKEGESDAKDGDGEDGKEEPNEAVTPKTMAKIAELETKVQLATAKVEAAKAAALTVRDEVLPAIKAEKLKEAHERLKAGLLEEATRVAGLLGDGATQAKFAAYKPTSATTGFTDGLAKMQRIEIKVFDFGAKDATEKAAQVDEAEKRLKATDLYLDLAQKQVAAFCKDGLNASAKDVLAIDALAAALPEEEGTRAAIAAARATQADAGVADAKKAGDRFVSELAVYRGLITARLAQAKDYHELGKRHTGLKNALKKKESATQADLMELKGMRAELEVLATQLTEAYERFEAEMSVLGDSGDASNLSRPVTQRIVVPFALFVIALIDVWRAQHAPIDDIELSTGLDPRSIEWLYPPVPKPSDPSPAGAGAEVPVGVPVKSVVQEVQEI